MKNRLQILLKAIVGGLFLTTTLIASAQTNTTSATSDSAAENDSTITTGEWSGEISLDTRLFFHDPEHPGQDDQNFSIALQPEYFADWDNGSRQFSFIPFFRYDVNDDERTHADVRELYLRWELSDFAVKAGMDVVFWGVAESRHLVDIINQTDFVENIDGEDKLGQPMINIDYLSDWGTWQFYLLPYFRERTFPGEDGRLRTEPPVDTDDALYDSSDEEEHVDWAVRWSHYFGDLDIGLAHFSGTSREPLLLLDPTGRKPSLVPFYPLIDQTSIDAQLTTGAWLWKLESIYNDNDFDDYYAVVGGFEFTQFNVLGKGADLGYLIEYNYDDRGETATTALQEDIYLGLRWSGNDAYTTEILAAIVFDTDNNSTFGNIEASRRLGRHWTLGVQVRLFENIDESDVLYQIRKDDYIEIQFARHF